jgi:signal transduction histidine kinase
LALVSGPWWIRLVGELRAERQARIREQERAEIAAHVHDSVLQTLALIQKGAQDPREVARVARRQERELRAWLYRPLAAGGQSGAVGGADGAASREVGGPANGLGGASGSPSARLGGALEAVAADVEEQYGTPIEVVLVGDCPLDERLTSAVQAAREAMVNAVKHSGADSIAVYAEAELDQVTVFVRDRGSGFLPASVAADRAGIRESVVGRMERHGGTAVIHSSPGNGTEIELSLPLHPAGSAR